MKATIKAEKEFEIKQVLVKAGVRYWEDGTVNGVKDENGDLIPCREGNVWCPLIDVETGKICNWEYGKTADIHYKVCDDGEYIVIDEDGNAVFKIEGYVPNEIIPGSYGDYIIMNIDEEGYIKEWDPNFEYLQENDELEVLV